jgi:hypothetical protein
MTDLSTKLDLIVERLEVAKLIALPLDAELTLEVEVNG